MKKIFLYIVIGIMLLAIPATLILVGQQQDIRKRAAPATTLALTPSTVQAAINDTFTLNVDITPATNQVTTVKIYVTYDVAKLEAQTITNGPLAPSVLNSGTVEGGIASITVGAASTTQPITTNGTVAKITFKAKEGTAGLPTAVQFTSNTFVGGLNEAIANVLVGSIPANVIIAGAGPAPSLTPTVTPIATATATLTPTLTPTLGATASGEASASAIKILTPANNASVTSAQPPIQGKAPAGSTVTLTIYSTPQTVIVTADANGNWIYTPTAPLDPGPHNVVASVQSASGTTQTSTSTFVVAGAGEAGASVSGIPISGNVETTILLVAVGLLFVVSGTLMPVFIQ